MNEHPRAFPDLHHEIGFTIPGRPPTPNARPGNWQAAKREHDEWLATAGFIAVGAKNEWEGRHGLRWRPLAAAILTVTFIAPDKRRRDFDNLLASAKPLIDGIVAAKLLVDDSTAVIRELRLAYVVARESATHFLIEQADE